MVVQLLVVTPASQMSPGSSPGCSADAVAVPSTWTPAIHEQDQDGTGFSLQPSPDPTIAALWGNRKDISLK